MSDLWIVNMQERVQSQFLYKIKKGQIYDDLNSRDFNLQLSTPPRMAVHAFAISVPYFKYS